MARNERIHLRVSSDEKKLLLALASKAKMPLSSYVLIHCIKKPAADPALLRLYDKAVTHKVLTSKQNELRTASWLLYFDKNALRRVYDSVTTSIYLTNDANMAEVRYIIDGYVDFWEAMPPDLKEIKRESVEELKKLKVKAYLLNKVHHFKVASEKVDRRVALEYAEKKRKAMDGLLSMSKGRRKK